MFVAHSWGREVAASATARPALQGARVVFLGRWCPDIFEDNTGPPAECESGGQVMAESFWLLRRHVVPSPWRWSRVNMKMDPR